MPSLSQRYRPKRFAEITGQTHVTETLRKEVATNTLGHAYLFSGPRGVGKTTAARVFAKALNCEAPQDGEPCNACALCVAANEGRLLDIIELDAATHTGVDTVREAIIEHVRFAPMLGKRKVYVIDEAHMLSTSSWNALLKTLEEPPAYAFFILATTEWHKVPATIVSRCQRFEFRRINDEALIARLVELAKCEGWNVTDDVLRLIISRADGCVRDAETLLGQLGSLGESTIDLDVASLVIPPSHLPLAAGLLRHWADRNHPAALTEAQRLFDDGIPILPLFDDLILILRKLLWASGSPESASLWSEGTEEQRAIADLVGRFSPGELQDLALLLFERRRDVKSGVDPLFALQLAGTVVANGLLKNAAPIVHRVSNEPIKPVIPTEVSKANETEGSLRVGRDDKTKSFASIQDDTNDGLELNTVRAKWNAIVRAVEEKNHSLPFILKLSQPVDVRGDVVVIRFSYPFHRDKILSDVKHRRVVEECMRAILDHKSLTIEGVVGEDPQVKEQRSTDMVSNILKAFGGTIVE